MPKRSKTSTRGWRAALSAKPRSAPRRIDFSDIPEASDQQLHAMRGVGQPPLAKALLGYWKIMSMEVGDATTPASHDRDDLGGTMRLDLDQHGGKLGRRD